MAAGGQGSVGLSAGTMRLSDITDEADSGFMSVKPSLAGPDLVHRGSLQCE